MKKIILIEKNNTIDAKVEGEIHLDEALQILLSTVQGFALGFIEGAKQADRQAVKEKVYDELNIAFGNVLDAIIPSEQIDDLTAQAIIEAENKIIEEAYISKKPLKELLQEKKDVNRVS